MDDMRQKPITDYEWHMTKGCKFFKVYQNLIITSPFLFFYLVFFTM